MRTFKIVPKTESGFSIRGMDMVVFALCAPVVMVSILGIIFGDRPAYQGAPYIFLEQSFEAFSTIAVCAGGVMGLPLLVSDYRQKHILKRFQVTPISSAITLAVHITIYAAYSLTSLVLVYASATLLFDYHMQGSPTALLLCYILVMPLMFSTGMMVEGIAPDMKPASVAVSVLYFPILIFSGTALPYEVMSESMQEAADLMPLTQGIELLKAVPLDQEPATVWIPMAIITDVFPLCSYISLHFSRWGQFYLGKEIRHAHLFFFLLAIKLIRKGKKAADIRLQAAEEIMQSLCSGGM